MRVRLMDAILAGSGLLMGWAATADYYEQKIKHIEEDYEWDRSRILTMAHQMVAEAEQGSDSEEESTQQEVEERNRSLHVAEDISDNELDDEADEEPYDEKIYEERRSNLQKTIDRYTNDPEAIQEFQDMLKSSDEADRRPPFVISQSSFAWDEEGNDYDKSTVTYYPNERVLVDDDEELISEVNVVIGWKNLNQFGFESNDPDVVFVRNPRLETDYEVVRDMENRPPIHIRLGMDLEEYNVSKAAGLLRFRPEEE